MILGGKPHLLVSVALASGSAPLFFGCGGDDATVTAGATPSPAPGASMEAADEPLYVVFTTIDTPEGRTGYFVTTPSIEGDATVDVSQGFEEPGGGQLYAPP